MKYPMVEVETMAVGKKWTHRNVPTQEGVYFETRESGAELIMAFDRPSKSEIKDTKLGKIQMGYYVRGPVIFIVCKIGSMPWMDAPYSIRLYDKYDMDLSWIDDIVPSDDHVGFAITIQLIDIRTGILYAIRLIGASHKFSVGLRNEIRKQQTQKFSEENHDKIIKEVYSSLTSEDLARRAENMFIIPAR